ncbi:MAG TPA: alpha/beta hydrolase [Cyclobacteriaceae bacterium]|nr:alpha/beta hydrolase [Cyclobacteriaceae bacterium]
MKKILTFFNLILFSCSLLVINSCIEDPTGPGNTLNGNSNLPESSLENVAYGTDTRQVYDIFLPANRDANTPIILMIHGGAWKAGRKEDFNSYQNLIKTKWSNVAIVNMNYRLASNANNIHHTEIMEDIDAVVNHVLANKTEYHISDKIGVIGASAGGQLAMIYAYKYNDNIKCVANIFGPSNLRDWSWYNSVNIWLGAYIGDILTEYVGQSWDTTAYKAVSPYWNVNSSTQPTIIFHGSLDPIVPVYQSQWMRGKLNGLGVTNQYHEYLAFHSFDNTQSNDVINKLIAFFKNYLE